MSESEREKGKSCAGEIKIRPHVLRCRYFTAHWLRMALPLNEQQLEFENAAGKTITIPALHPSRKEKMVFVLYLPPPRDLSDRGGYEEWLERMRFVEEDLHWLLQLPHDKFWCQAVFDEKLHRCLDAYLRHAPRSYDVVEDLPDEARIVHQEIHRLVFMTYLRMATHKESKDDQIVPKVFGDILYENFIFDIPKLMDLCALYGRENGPLLSKMINNIFTQQPKYKDDLKATIPTIFQVFDNILAKCGTDGEGGGSFSPQKLDQPHRHGNPLVTMAIEELEDVMYYLSDTSVTLSAFMEVCSMSCQIFYKAGFTFRMAAFYDSLIPMLTQAIKTRQYEVKRTKVELKRRLHQSKKYLIKCFHQIVQRCCIQPILENSQPLQIQEHVEDFLEIFSNIQGDRRFLADYESENTFQDDVDILSQSPCTIDETRLQFIQDGINSAFATYGRRKKPKGAKNAGGRESPDGSVGSDGGGATAGGVMMETRRVDGDDDSAEFSRFCPSGYSLKSDDYEGDGACARSLTGVELDSLITSVKDLLPDLGEGFIELCLEELNYDVERVINAVLEEKLPPSLWETNRHMARAPKEEKTNILEERRNIFDYDEFDVFNRDTVDQSRIFKGKKAESGMEALDDKADLVSALKPLYDRYGSGVAGESVYDPDMYDDEYDDTYDTGIVGADDADSADELTTRRPFTTPRILGIKNEFDKPSNSADSDEESGEEEPKRDEFVANPALVRAKAEERQQWKAPREAGKRGQGPSQRSQGQGQPQRSQGQGLSQRSQGQGQPQRSQGQGQSQRSQGQGQPQRSQGQGQSQRSQGQGSQRRPGQGQGRPEDGEDQGRKKYDVKGNPKGQGQDSDVLRNRKWKEKHKSTGGNHNRKDAADRKRMN